MRTLMGLFAALSFAACGGEEKGGAGGGHEGHAHEHGKYGGEIVELAPPGAADEGHVEMVVDHDAGTVTIWASNPDDTEMAFDEPPVLNFTSETGPVSVPGRKEGAGWVFTHNDLKGDPANARFRLKKGAKVYTPELAHHH